MSNNNSNPNKDNESEKKIKEPQTTIAELKQDINQLKAEKEHKERILRLRTGEVDIEDLDTIPFYKPFEWASREEYEEKVADKVDIPV